MGDSKYVKTIKNLEGRIGFTCGAIVREYDKKLCNDIVDMYFYLSDLRHKGKLTEDDISAWGRCISKMMKRRVPKRDIENFINLKNG